MLDYINSLSLYLVHSLRILHRLGMGKSVDNCCAEEFNSCIVGQESNPRESAVIE